MSGGGASFKKTAVWQELGKLAARGFLVKEMP
jgi:hypothetical protein